MKKVAGTLKIDQAQYRELEAFTKFGEDMDAVTKMTIDKGRKNTVLLKQNLHQTMFVEHQIAILYCGTHGLLANIDIGKVQQFEKELIGNLESLHRKDVLDVLKGGVINGDVENILQAVASDICKQLE